MKLRLGFLALGLVCLCGRAQADTVTTGNLSFTCLGGPCFAPAPPLTPFTQASTAPTSGSFTYDNTTGQFLDFTFTWNGIDFGVNGLTEDHYLALIGSGPNVFRWNGICVGGAENRWPQFSCDDGLFFGVWLVNVSANTASDGLGYPGGISVISFNYPSTYATDGAIGDMTATNLTTTTVPEPTVSVLLLLGIGFTFLLRERGSIFLCKRSFHS